MAWGLLDPRDAYPALWESLIDALSGETVEIDLDPDIEGRCRQDLDDLIAGVDDDHPHNRAEPYDEHLFFALLFAAAWQQRKTFWQHLLWSRDIRRVHLQVSCTGDGIAQLRLPGF
jgi:hypothetical protein